MDWVRLPTGRLCPIDQLPATREPRPLDVVVLVAEMRGFIVSAENLEVARQKLEVDGVRLHESHWETCPSATRHRDGGINPNQESLL